jgi:hypothetical protein
MVSARSVPSLVLPPPGDSSLISIQRRGSLGLVKIDQSRSGSQYLQDPFRKRRRSVTPATIVGGHGSCMILGWRRDYMPL